MGKGSVWVDAGESWCLIIQIDQRGLPEKVRLDSSDKLVD